MSASDKLDKALTELTMLLKPEGLPPPERGGEGREQLARDADKLAYQMEKWADTANKQLREWAMKVRQAGGRLSPMTFKEVKQGARELRLAFASFEDEAGQFAERADKVR